MSLLRIYFSGQWRDSNSPCPWALCDEKGALLQTGIAALAMLPKGHECVAIVAAERLLSIAATLPAGGRRRWQSVLPFVAEEFTLADPEENHVVPGPALADGRRMLAVVDKSWLKRIVDSAHSARLSLRRMVAETFLPALAADSWTVVWDGSSGFVRTGAASGTALDVGDAAIPPLALRLSLDAAPQLPKKIEIRFVHDVSAELRTMPHWPELQLVAGADWDWRRGAIPEDALNLLCGDFAPRAKIQEWWPKLRPAAYLLLAVLAVELLGTNFEWAMLANEKNQLAKNMQRTFRATFGDSVTLVNATLQMQRNLAELKHAAGVADTGDFLPLLNISSRPLAALPVGSVVAMHYEAGRLDIDVRLARSADFAGLKQSILSGGLGVRVGEIRDLGNGAEARLTLLPEGMP
ncbi:MAG TPA: type II secretion system protein GspL [Gallionellaceae bacterium]|nr:type II secretion system protein GspL [Gallionellaceae bacterium]